MATLHLVTGYQGTPHVTSANQGLFNACCFGEGDYVLNVGKKFEATISNNNLIKLSDGSFLMQGRYGVLEPGGTLDVTIENGTQGMNRNDLITLQYEKDTSSGVESVNVRVLKGTDTAGTATDPIVSDTNILNGDVSHDMPLYRVRLTGLQITAVEALFKELQPLSDVGVSQNLLINGDFQCNQRGLKTYEAVTTTEVMYSVDMWRIHQLKLEVLFEGVRITGNTVGAGNGYLTQFVQLRKLTSIPYTISAMVDDELCTFTLVMGAAAKEKNFGKFKITALCTSKWDNDLGDYDNKLKINICPIDTNSIVIKWVSLCEGTIPKPHKREDAATALMRCRRYIQKNGYVSPIMYYNFDGTNDIYTYGICVNDMISTYNNPARISYLTASMYDGTGNGYQSSTTGSTTTYPDDTRTEVAVGSVTVVRTSRKQAGENSYNKDSTCYGVKGVYIATSEPRDA